MNSRFAIALAIFLTCLTTAARGIEVTGRMSSQFLVRGERAYLEIALVGGEPARFPSIPKLADVEIRQASRIPQTRMLPGRIMERVFLYEVTSYQTGIHTIPPIGVELVGTQATTRPVRFEVFDPNELEWFDAESGQLRFRYAATFRSLNPRPYEGEVTATEMKLYVPRDLLVDDWGIPSFERDGVTAWRFQPSYSRSQVNLLGSSYIGTSYPSLLTPTRTGEVGMGPAKVRLMTIQTVIDGFPQRKIFEAHLTIPKLTIEAIPLPVNAPVGFTNAVGQFEMTVHADEIEFQEGDPIPVEIRISGSGNLDNLDPPQPVDTEGWKVYEAAKDPRASEREELSGTVVFRQFMRPLEIKGALTPYRFVYFDPAKREYQTLTSEPIPLLIKPSPSSPATPAPLMTADTPTERMTDILSIVTPASLTIPPSENPLPSWWWQAVAAALAAVLITKALWMRIAPRLRRDPVRSRQLGEWQQLRKTDADDDRSFLLAAGRFIERWLGDRQDSELAAILAERDQSCFRPEPEHPRTLSTQRRNEILRILRNAIPALLVAFVLGAGSAHAETSTSNLHQEAATAYQEARFDDAIRIWLQAGRYETLAADTLYNIGNACYRSGSPGHAALYYRRALLRDPQHPESRQNLRFIERKYGALTIQRPEYQYVIARIPRDVWQGTCMAGAWMLALGFLVFPATRPGARIRVAAAIACILGPMIGTAGALGWYHFPNDSRFAPVERLAVVVAPDAVVYTDASRNSNEVIDAPPGSLCEVVRLSGRWAYISFATKTRGWIPSEMIEPIIPQTPPTPPRIRKPQANESST